MKYVIIGDVHGRTNWKQIIEKENDADKFIFLGDYFDPYGLQTPNDMMINFENIIDFKMDNYDKVVLLLGNHDIHYISQNFSCREVDELKDVLKEIFKSGVESNIFKLCYFISEDIVCSHAGFSNSWLHYLGLKLEETELNLHFKLAVQIDNLIDYDFIYKDYFQDMSGDNSWQSPLWIRVPSLMYDKPDEIIQCIGHSRINKLSNTLDFLNSKGILLCDCLEHNKYHTYEYGEFKFKNIND
jgi:hypothetical protein